MSTQFNPYAAPTAEVADLSGADPQAEAIRQEHIKHEASIKSVGILYYISAVVLAFIFLGQIVLLTSAREDFALSVIMLLVFGGFGAVSFYVANGLRKLKPTARKVAIGFAGVGLLGVPLGTLVNGYILYLLLSQKGRRIFEPDYLDVIEATAHIKHRTSIVVWVVLGLILFGIAAAIIIPMMSR